MVARYIESADSFDDIGFQRLRGRVGDGLGMYAAQKESLNVWISQQLGCRLLQHAR
jgi:hypothetical protein